MTNKWLIYTATYASYSIIHSIRTCWASLKTVFTSQPYEFGEGYLGTLDMIVLFTIAILLNVLGRHVERYSRRRLLFFMMGGLIVNLVVLFLLMYKEVSSQVVYFVFYMTVGILSCLAWPICLYTTSQYFTSANATALSMWSSVSQCGDFVAFLITLIVLQTESIHASYSMLFLIVLFIIVTGYDYFFFYDQQNALTEQISSINQVQTPQNQVNREMEERKSGSDSALKHPPSEVNSQSKDRSEDQEKDHEQKMEISCENQNRKKMNRTAHLNFTNIQPQIEPQPQAPPHHHESQPQPNPSPPQNKPTQQQHSSHSHSQPQSQPQPHIQPQPPAVTFLTVWLLPGVAFPVLAFSTIKSINAIIVSWLVLYFTKIDMIKESRIIAIVWTFSIVLGGYIGAKINSFLSYKIFIAQLFICTFLFYFLQGLHVQSNELAIIILVAICGTLIGGPFNQIGTAVPLKLSQQPQIKSIPQSKSAIISLMQSFAQMVCGLSILIVPEVGVMKLHYMAGFLCFLSVLLLVGEEVRQYLGYKYVLDLIQKQRHAAPAIQLKEEP